MMAVERLRICMIAACPFPANHGTPGSIREMAEGLAALGHDIHIVTYHHGDEVSLQGLRVHRIARLTAESTVVVGPTIRRPLYDTQMVLKTLEVLRRHPPHLLHAHGYEAALIASACRVFTRHPVVYSAHNTMGDELPSYGFIRPQSLARAVASLLDHVVPRLADRCLPHSRNTHQFLERQGLRARTDGIVNFGIDVNWMGRGDSAHVRKQYGLHGARVILYTGVLDRFQRLDLLIDAMVSVARHHPSAKLLIVTTVHQPHHVNRVLTHAAERGVSDRVIVTDPQPLESVRDFLQLADVAVVPRPSAAGFPIKLLNYMAAARPSVLFASSASSGIVHRKTAMLAEPDTSQALAQAIAGLLDDDHLREAIGRNGLAFVQQHHDRQTIARQVVACYRRALMQEQPRRDECHACSS